MNNEETKNHSHTGIPMSEEDLEAWNKDWTDIEEAINDVMKNGEDL